MFKNRKSRSKFFKLKKRAALGVIKKKLNTYPTILKPNPSEFINKLKKKKLQIKYLITIRVTANNVFCTFKDMKKNNTIIISSAGKYKIKVSKKSLKFNHKTILQKFLENFKKINIRKALTLIKVSAPIKLKKQIINTLIESFKKNKFILNIKSSKCFNGCRPSKKVRKKKRKFRIVK
jgi:ribosomal protein S11